MVHVHLSDNRLRRDDHMPLGAGRIGWPRVIQLIQKTGYDDTITLEVFSTDPDYVLLSARKVREWWDQARLAAQEAAAQREAEEAEETEEAEEVEEAEAGEETEAA
ncbi:MAG: sugar phosphate isomerase/epimerase [Chloroflexaceae bacterium]|nr:sugar phosphate isomerase/epimerase [Chloroflexaceae bacterium]